MGWGSFSFSAKTTHHWMIWGATGLPFCHFIAGRLFRLNHVKLAEILPCKPFSASANKALGVRYELMSSPRVSKAVSKAAITISFFSFFNKAYKGWMASGLPKRANQSMALTRISCLLLPKASMARWWIWGRVCRSSCASNRNFLFCPSASSNNLATYCFGTLGNFANNSMA